MKIRSFLKIAAMGFLIHATAQDHSHQSDRALKFPDIPGYTTLKADLHIHTAFSDGSVWPDIRVQEALRDNLDAIAITEHIEYQPHKADIPHPDRNRSYQIALDEAKDHDLLIVPGSEITRSAPVGHSNAVFIKDANALIADAPEKPFREAKAQGAFVFWNHPAWYAQSPNGIPILSDFQKARIAAKELQGIEVVNYVDYAEESLALALEYELTIMGNSDIHGLIDWDYVEKGKSRPVTLIFAKEKSLDAMKDALFAGRTVAAYTALWIGRPEYLVPLLEASVQIEQAAYIGDTNVLEVVLRNVTSSDLLFENAMPYTLYNEPPIFEIEAGQTITLNIKTLDRIQELSLDLKVLGAYTAPKTHPMVHWKVIPSPN